MTEPFDGSDPRLPPTLSAAALARREAILPVLERALVARIRRRRIVRAGSATAVLAMVALGTLMLSRSPTPRPVPFAGNVEPSQPAESGLTMRYASLRVSGVQPADLPRSEPAHLFVEIDDETLLRELREMGRPTGLIRARGQVVLTNDIGVSEPPTDSGQG